MYTREDNDVTSCIGALYAEKDIELSWSIGLGVDYDENQIRQWHDYTCMFNHIVVMSCFRHRFYLVRSGTTTQFHFQCRPYLYNQLCHCRIWFSSQTASGPIGHDNSVSFSAYTTPIWSVTLLSCLVFITNRSQSNRSWQFIFNVRVNHTYTISNIIVLFGFHHKLDTIRLEMVQSVTTT